jgi:SAM-dependent methyltransferase
MYFPGESPSQVLHRKVSGQSHQSSLLKYVERLHPEPGTILEWGCGGGWNLIPFRDAGWETLGFDYDAAYISLGREYHGLNLQQITSGVNSSTIGSLPDVILLNHVLEHSSNPVELLQLLRDLSGPNTLIVVGVPLLETIRQWHWNDFFHVAHIHYFSADSLRKVAIRAGLRLVDESVVQGLFAFAVQGSSGDSWSGVRLRTVMKSSILLFRGWIDVEFRLRAFVRGILKVTRLLGLARRLRSITKR